MYEPHQTRLDFFAFPQKEQQLANRRGGKLETEKGEACILVFHPPLMIAAFGRKLLFGNPDMILA